MDMIDVLARMDERLERQDAILAKMDDRLERQNTILARMDERQADQNRLLDRMAMLVDIAREEALAAHQSSTRVLQRLHEQDLRVERALVALERALSARRQP